MAKTILSANDGKIHLPGSAFNTFETACGACETDDTYTESSKLPTCHGCLDAAETIFSSITTFELKRAKHAIK